MNKQQKIEALTNLLKGNTTVKEFVKTLPVPLSIDWGDEDETFNVFMTNGKRVTRAEFEKAIKLRAKHNG